MREIVFTAFMATDTKDYKDSEVWILDYCDRIGGTFGGVALYVKDSLIQSDKILK